jgi:hypothetical protein
MGYIKRGQTARLMKMAGTLGKRSRRRPDIWRLFGVAILCGPLLTACLLQDRQDAVEIESSAALDANAALFKSGSASELSELFELSDSLLSQHCKSALLYKQEDLKIHRSFVSSCGSCHSETGSAPRSLTLNSLNDPAAQFQVLSEYITRFAPASLTQVEQHPLLTNAQGKNHPTVVWPASSPSLFAAIQFVYLELAAPCDVAAAIAASKEPESEDASSTGEESESESESFTLPGVIPEDEF